MRRRDFVLRSAAGLLVPGLSGVAHGNPCPPPTLGLDGGVATGTCSGGAGAPAWFGALGHKTWGTPVANWLGASEVIDPRANGANSGLTGHPAIIEAWTGMGADQGRRWIFMLHNGGHNDYYGNEVYSCDLSAATPVWIRRRNASVATGSGNVSQFSDGRPASDHTTNLPVEAEGRWFTPGMASTNYNGFANYNRWWEFNPTTNDYISLGSNHASAGGAVHGLALWDAVDRQMVVMHTDNQGSEPSVEYQNITNMAGAPALTNTNWLPISQSPMGAIDTTNRVLLVRAGSQYFWLRLNSNSNKQAPWNQMSASGAAPSSENQIHWHAPSNAFITWNGSSGLRKLVPTVNGSGNYTGLTWTSVSGNGGPTPPSGPAAGMYSKIQLINNMGNGDSALIVVPRYGSPDVYVMRLQGAV